MDSDSDLFESADEDFGSDSEEKHKKSTAHCDTTTEATLNVNSISLEEQHTTSVHTDTKALPQETKDQNENPTSATETENEAQRKRKERPQRTREPKTKLGVKLGTKVKKSDFDWDKVEDSVSAEPGWENDADWTPIENTCEPSQKLYSEKASELPDEDFWNDEANYMELPRESEKERSRDDEKPERSNSETSGGWSTWGNWGVSSLLSTASLGVSTLTSSVSQGITTVLETGIGIPDPEELARVHKEREKSIEKTEETKAEPATQNQPQIGFGLGNLVSGVSHITKLVETTGTKVLTGGLDTLEVIGKKTMEVLQEGDPGLKKKRALFKIDQNKPVLSQILREAKEKAEAESEYYEERKVMRKPHYETIFDDYQGLVHLEALEMLSKQCDIKLESVVESTTGKALADLQETLAQIKELCELPDEDEDNEISDVESVRERIDSAVTDLNVKITYEPFLKTWSNTEAWLQEPAHDETAVHQKAIESLAELTANAVEQFHKTGELLLVKERRSTVDEADSLVQLTIILTAVIGLVAGKFSEKLNTLATPANSDNINNLITNIFFEAANSSSYIQDAFNLIVPVLQVGAI